MARTLTIKHAHPGADADAEGFPASENHELMEGIRSMMEKNNDVMRSMLGTQNDIMADKMQGVEKRLGKRLSNLEDMMGILEDKNDIMANKMQVRRVLDEGLKATLEDCGDFSGHIR
jgi:hypothetical protein